MLAVSSNISIRQDQIETVLVSHQGADKQYHSHEGYLGAPDFYPLQDDDIDPFFRREDTGLTTYILGFTPPSHTDWQILAAQAAIENFFHGIVRGKAVFDIEGDIISSDNIDSKWTRELPDLEQEMLNFIRLSTKPPEAKCHVDGIGDVNLYLETTDDLNDNRRDIALVRDSGMLITDQLPNMNLPGMRREGSLPRNLKGFTAIIECLSHGGPSLIRDAESANHTAVRIDIIEDENRRKLAARQLAKLGQWVKSVLQERAKREVQSRIESADELNDYITLVGEALPGSDGIVPTNYVITKPYQTESGVTAGVTRGGTNSTGITLTEEEDDNQETTTRVHDKRKWQKRKTRKKRSTTSSPNPFSGLRFIRTDDNATHQITAIFNSPSHEIRGIKLLSVGEDGTESVVGLKNHVEINGKRAVVKNNTVRSIAPADEQSRITIKFDTQEPVAMDGQTLKSFHLRHGDDQA